MYEQYFGLQTRPFAYSGGGCNSVLHEQYDQALAQFSRQLITGNGIGLLTGPPGTGKTHLCRDLSTSLNDQLRVVFLKTAAYPTKSSLLQAILFSLGKRFERLHEQELRLHLIDAAEQIAQHVEGIAIIVDEAHLLSPKLLEELRSLTNFDLAGYPLFRLMLSGHSRLEETLARPDLDALNQRISVQYTLSQLKRDESLYYLQQRLTQAGGHLDELITPEAQVLIVHTCDGVPRMLNHLTDHAFSLAALMQTKVIDETIARQAYEDLKSLPLHWNPPSSSLDPIEQWQQEKQQRPGKAEGHDCAIPESEPEECGAATQSAEPASVEFDFHTQSTTPEFAPQVSPAQSLAPVQSLQQEEMISDIQKTDDEHASLPHYASSWQELQIPAEDTQISVVTTISETISDCQSGSQTQPAVQAQKPVERQQPCVIAINDPYAELDALLEKIEPVTRDKQYATSSPAETGNVTKQAGYSSPDFISGSQKPLQDVFNSTSQEEDIANSLLEALDETQQLRERLSEKMHVPVDELEQLMMEDEDFDLVFPEEQHAQHDRESHHVHNVPDVTGEREAASEPIHYPDSALYRKLRERN